MISRCSPLCGTIHLLIYQFFYLSIPSSVDLSTHQSIYNDRCIHTGTADLGEGDDDADGHGDSEKVIAVASTWVWTRHWTWVGAQPTDVDTARGSKA